MLQIFSAIINYFKKRKFKKYVVEINNYLDVIETKQAYLDSTIEKLNRQRTYITNEQIDDISDEIINEYEYLVADRFYAINDEVLTFVEKNKELLFSLDVFRSASYRFFKLREQFLEKINTLNEVVKWINSAIKRNANITNKFFNEVKELKKEYITNTLFTKLLQTYKEAYDFFETATEYINERIPKFLNCYRNLKGFIKIWNNEYIQRELAANKELFDNIDGKSLDLQQRTAIITDEDNNLVLAGAGSGKTLTISGKVKYLVDKKGVSPEEILLISFTRKAKEEMYDRISNKLGVNVDVATFHSLGLKIISKCNGNSEVIKDKETSKIVTAYLKDEIYNDKKQIQNLINFFGYYIKIPKDLDDFEDLSACNDYYKNMDFETLKSKYDKASFIKAEIQERKQDLETIKGETVRSLEEFIIANFLYLNGINYIYEHQYEYVTSKYKPDFYLPDYDIYIEHFGVNEKMEAPWLSEAEEKKYVKGIEWKRNIHKGFDTTLIESFSYYNKNGVLLQKLEDNLHRHNVKFRKIDYKDIFDTIYDNSKDKHFTELIKLINTFIQLFKSNKYTYETFDELIKQNQETESNIFLKKRTEIFLELVKSIYKYYEDYLRCSNKIDFNDMINMSTDIVKEGMAQLNYKYIIIDEYQDISISRFYLIQAIRDKTNAKIMSVGDDWQSIFRFAGSDISLFTSFQKYFGPSSLLKIEKTYRNSQELIDVAGKFVMMNKLQLGKNLKSDNHNNNPIRIAGYQKYKTQALKLAIDEIVSEFGENTEIMLLGRNNYDIDFIDKYDVFHKEDKKQENKVEVSYSKYPNLKMYFLTAHKSKGLEEKNVILLNADNKITGFPNQIVDDPVLTWVLPNTDTYEFTEERRLFYVALTRTKNYIYILAPEPKMSVFVKELIEEYDVKYQIITGEESFLNNPKCPKCRTGYLVLRKVNKDFVGCSNYPSCDKIIWDVGVLKNPAKFKSGGEYMVSNRGRKSPYTRQHKKKAYGR